VAEGLTDTPQGVGRGEIGHVPVLLKGAIDFLAVRRGGTYIDATVGLGGHSLEIAKRLGQPGHLIGFDKDPKALEIAGSRLQASGLETDLKCKATRGCEMVGMKPEARSLIKRGRFHRPFAW